MANIQKTLDSLQPYVIGIRYSQGLPLVDTVFKEGWTLPESQTIKKAKGNDEMNYYMIYGETPSITIDNLLEYVGLVIKANQEKEKKQELLKIKFDEMKKLFKTLPLTKLQLLRFNFEEVLDDEISINDVDIEINEDTQPEQEEEIIKPQIKIEQKQQIARLVDEKFYKKNHQVLYQQRLNYHHVEHKPFQPKQSITIVNVNVPKMKRVKNV
jgi:hypothetical protein